MTEFRVEKDTMGDVRVPADALWGPQTQRAVDNFPISGFRFPRVFIESIALVKRSVAEANAELGLLDPKLAQAIVAAANEVAEGRHDAHFPLDIYQTGSGTSTNMNANEVIANVANLRLGGRLGTRGPRPPDAHGKQGQSRNA